MTLLFD